MKKIINDPNEVVTESLRGFAAAHADLVNVSYGPDFIARSDAPVSGQGRPRFRRRLRARAVARRLRRAGMLDAAVPGAVFTSPTPDACSRPRRPSTPAPASCTS